MELSSMLKENERYNGWVRYSVCVQVVVKWDFTLLAEIRVIKAVFFQLFPIAV